MTSEEIKDVMCDLCKQNFKSNFDAGALAIVHDGRIVMPEEHMEAQIVDLPDAVQALVDSGEDGFVCRKCLGLSELPMPPKVEHKLNLGVSLSEMKVGDLFTSTHSDMTGKCKADGTVYKRGELVKTGDKYWVENTSTGDKWLWGILEFWGIKFNLVSE